MWFRKGLALLLVLVGVMPAVAQVAPVYSFTSGTVISSAEINANFAMLSSALNRTGGTITGNIAVDSGITIDGIDLSAWLNQAVLTTSSPTFAALTVTGAATVGTTLGVTGNVAVNTNKFTVAALTGNTLVAGTLDVSGAADFAGAITAGSGNVGIIDATGKIPAISSTYFASLSGTNLTGVALLGSTNAFTARNDLLTYTETRTVLTPGANVAIDLALGSHFTYANTTAPTFTFTNPPTSGKAGSFTLAITGDGTSRPPVWPGSVVWPSGVAPTVTSTNAKSDFFTFITYNGGTTWFGFVGGQNY